MRSLLLILFLLLHLSNYSAAARTISEVDVLIAVKTSITNDPQSYLLHWNVTTPLCSFTGVTCDHAGRHVISIDLTNFTLSGSLSPSFAHLRFLRSLSVAANLLSGPIPTELAGLSSLRYLNLSNNGFNGSFPPQLSHLKSLQVLDLYNNNMAGELPVSVTELPNLRHLHLGGNYFSGQIPSSYGRWEHLEYLAVSGNGLGRRIPPEIGNLTKLQQLYICDNTFEGGLPPEIGNLSELGSKLVRFDAANCNLFGEIPPEMGRLQKLDTLFLQFNALSGSLVPELGTLKSLKSMDLSSNMLTGEIPESFTELKNLSLLNLLRNKLEGQILELIGDSLFTILVGVAMANVVDEVANDESGDVVVSSDGNGVSNVKTKSPALDVFSKSVPTSQVADTVTPKGGMSGDLDLSAGAVEGEVASETEREPTACGSLGNEVVAHNEACVEGENVGTAEHETTASGSCNISPVLDSTNSSGSCSGELLRAVFLHSTWENNFTGSIPQKLGSGSNKKLRILDLSFNKLTGQIPSSIWNLSSLAVLSLWNNSLDGTIPECIGSLTSSLSRLDLRMNRFHGKIPEFSQGCKLQSLLISNNQIQGPLPRSLSNCKDLKLLDAGNNYLNDSFPNCLGYLNHLQVLILRWNKFHGQVGRYDIKVSFPRLRVIDLSHNNLNGYLPVIVFENLHAIKEEYEMIGKPEYMIETEADGTTYGTEGHIPSTLGDLSKLESLDLSSNKFHGRIPTELKSLGFLEVLNLSHNNLKGPIPQGKQFDTFSNDSYIGNLGLCGLPLSKGCDNDEETPPKLDRDDDNDELNWKFSILMGYGCGLVLGLSMGYIVFTTGKPWWFIRIFKRVRHRAQSLIAW
ncbi:hypothetical protein V6N11_033464 [Hibiscus sabdariffa]|uniref:Leucine-rich repeat-containing N-terminal plant-type domain-containing protein n=1 Tax=Hibiscus sabdariffa TaxID=183260 RepID=A0ABR2PYD3_9ROSI